MRWKRSIAGSVVRSARPASATVPITRSITTVENAAARLGPWRDASKTRAMSPPMLAGRKLLKNSPTWK